MGFHWGLKFSRTWIVWDKQPKWPKMIVMNTVVGHNKNQETFIHFP